MIKRKQKIINEIEKVKKKKKKLWERKREMELIDENLECK